MAKLLRHKWHFPPKQGDLVRRLNPNTNSEITVGKIYTVKKATTSTLYFEGSNRSYSTSYFEPANIPVSQLVKTENYQIF